jgi:hypothetical protein
MQAHPKVASAHAWQSNPEEPIHADRRLLAQIDQFSPSIFANAAKGIDVCVRHFLRNPYLTRI